MGTPRPQRNTRQRQVILEELQKLTSHPTAAGLYGSSAAGCLKSAWARSIAIWNCWRGPGLIQKLDFAGGEARFDGNVERHDHLRCVECGRVDDVSVAALDLSGGYGE